MTNLIHIVGQQGIGKTTLALDIIAGLHKRGKTGHELVESEAQFSRPITYAELRNLKFRQPYAVKSIAPDYIIVEHVVLPKEIDSQPGDLVIRIEHATQGGAA